MPAHFPTFIEQTIDASFVLTHILANVYRYCISSYFRIHLASIQQGANGRSKCFIAGISKYMNGCCLIDITYSRMFEIHDFTFSLTQQSQATHLPLVSSTLASRNSSRPATWKGISLPNVTDMVHNSLNNTEVHLICDCKFTIKRNGSKVSYYSG